MQGVSGVLTRHSTKVHQQSSSDDSLALTAEQSNDVGIKNSLTNCYLISTLQGCRALKPFRSAIQEMKTAQYAL